MSSGKLTIEIDGDEAKAHASFMALTKDQKALVAEIGKMGTEAEKAASKSIQAAKEETKTRNDQLRLAESLVKKNETLAQSYEREKKALEVARQQGKISNEQYEQTLTALNKKVQENSAEYIQASQKKQEAVKLENEILKDQIRVADGIIQATKTATDKFNEKKVALTAAWDAGKISSEEYAKGLMHIQAEADEAKKKLEDIEPATEKGFGRVSQEMVLGWGVQFVSAAAGVRLVSDALKQVKADRDAALGIGESLEVSRRDLRGLSGDFAELDFQADEISLATGMDRAKSRQLVFTGQSQNVPFEDQMLAAQVGKFADSNVAIAYMADLKDQFKAEQLSGEQALNIALSAADASKFNPTAMLPQLQTAAIGGKVAKWSSVDTAAMTGVLASSFGQSTGTRVSALASKIGADERFKGMDGVDALYMLSQFSDDQKKEFIGGDRTMAGTLETALESLPDIDALANEIAFQKRAAGTEQSFTQQKLATTFDVSTDVGRLATAERERDIALRKSEIQTEKRLLEKSLDRKVDEIEAEQFMRDVRNTTHSPIGGNGFVSRFVRNMVFGAGVQADQVYADTMGTVPQLPQRLEEGRERREESNRQRELELQQQQLQKTDQQTEQQRRASEETNRLLSRLVDKETSTIIPV